ncbi:hypothetical protein PSN13_00313 [Micromonospora saelicesensis]|uniref:Uncharacterized protein n=1 Tax=Micromonospora saelicesensis TaxID=285676 RepID=A0A328NXM3_9ACTN|nr:hypothetical protein [Micromonospora saelicesensis]RAO39289.1 hypothetical protein PSN13_00313 [Micromonospora saelicesensis]
MRTNAAMRRLLGSAAFAADQPTVPELEQDTLDAGWTVEPSGALLLVAHRPKRVHDIPAEALGEGEYEINDVHVSLDDLGREKIEFLPRAASRGLYFARRMLGAARGLPGSETLLAAVAIHVDVDDEDFALQGATIRFFSRRGSYPRWFDELEAYTREAIAVLDLSDPTT